MFSTVEGETHPGLDEITYMYLYLPHNLAECPMVTVSYTDFRQHLAKHMEEVWDSRAPLRVTRQNARSVIGLSEEEYDSLMETLHLLRSPANAARLLRSIGSAEAGDPTEHAVAEEPLCGE